MRALRKSTAALVAAVFLLAACSTVPMVRKPVETESMRRYLSGTEDEGAKVKHYPNPEAVMKSERIRRLLLKIQKDGS